MSRAKMVYVSEEAHRRLRLLAARRTRPMGRVVEELVEEELADLVNPWTSTEDAPAESLGRGVGRSRARRVQR